MNQYKTKDEIISNKKDAIKRINKLLEGYINSYDCHLQKKADLISYWIKEYTKYLQWEEQYCPTKQMTYSRGDIVRVNFGFRLDKEYGGLHYAVVLDKANYHNSSVITVIPLTSDKGKATYHRNVNLGSELYSRINDKIFSSREEISQKIADCTVASEFYKALKSQQNQIGTDNEERIDHLYVKINEQLNYLKNEIWKYSFNRTNYNNK